MRTFLRRPCLHPEIRRPRPAGALKAAAACTILVTHAGCSGSSARIPILPPGDGLRVDASTRIHASSPRSRSQHTTSSTGESLFPFLAPDGKTLYFASSVQGPSFGIVRKTLGAAALTAVTGGRWNDIHPVVSPDGKRLAFTSDREGGWNVYVLEFAGRTPPRRLTRLGGESMGPSWSPDSLRLAFFRRGIRETWELWTVDVEKGVEEYLCPGLFPSWSPKGTDGEWISFQASRGDEGWYSIWKVRPDGTQPTQIATGEGWGAVHPSWSPDGRWVAFAAVGKGSGTSGAPERPTGGDIYIIGADGARLVNLTADIPGVSEWNPSFGPDGRIYFNSDEEGVGTIWSLDPGLGK
jgi:Tol biopolymer transport system component